MELQRSSDPTAFLAQVGAFLEAHEAENCVPIGTLMNRSQTPVTKPIYCAAVTKGEDMRAVAVMTPPFHLLITRAAPDEAVALIARDLAGGAWEVRGVMAEPATSLAFATTWRRLTGHAYAPTFSQRIYHLTRVIPVVGVPGQMRAITAVDRPLLRRWLVDFEQEALGTQLLLAQIDERIDQYLTFAAFGLYLWDVAGVAVALAGHTGPTPHGMRVGPVYTPPDERGHGYASALVAALSQMLLDGGRQFCFLFTDLANPTSNRIYQSIGYQPVCDVQVYAFS